MGRGIAPIVLGALLGRRLPRTRATLTVDGLRGTVTIRRDRWGIPHIDARGDDDAWYALGFCEGQDRAFQLETLVRVVRGTLSELVGPPGLQVDRLSRRIGFARAGAAEVGLLDPPILAAVDAFARGVNAGRTRGLGRRPHELALLRGAMTPWTAADAVGVLKLQTFALSVNWDIELARMRIASADGPDALRDLDAPYPAWLPVAVPPGALAGDLVTRVRDDVGALARIAGAGGSNNWALAPSRTATGRPLLANDPHLAPVVPSPWYLAHVRTTEWSIAGAAFVGGPAIPIGHNGHAAWGVTAGCADNSDLFVEEVGPDGASVREGDAFVPCEVRVERIAVKGAAPVEERVLVTRRGPIVGPALLGGGEAVSLRATWLDPAPAEGLLGLHRVRSFDDFRRAFARWREVSLNMAYADESGTIGYQLIGDVPRRRRGDGSMPLDGRTSGAGWHADPVPFDEMPHCADPEGGFVATANTKPDGGDALGVDFIDGYRLGRIVERLGETAKWDADACRSLQMDVTSLPWREMRETVLAASAADPALAAAHALLERWDGRLAADSIGAALYELFVADLTVAIAKLRAPASWQYAVGAGFSPVVPVTLLAVRRVAHFVRMLRERPEGWCGRPWPDLIRASMRAAWRTLAATERGGRLPGWGELRPLTLRHAFTGRRPIDKAFTLGPFPWGGDANTPSQAAVDPRAPLGNPLAVATVRAVIDVGRWDDARFVLPGGQSGNPCSRHYDDQLPLWRRGGSVPMPFSEDAVRAATRETLRLEPLG